MNSTWNKTWNNNITVFEKRFPGLYKMYGNIIKDISAVSENDLPKLLNFWTVLPAKNNTPTAFIQDSSPSGVQKIFLHSSYNPQREAYAAACKIKDSEKNAVIFFGTGLGYQLCETAEILEENVKIILIEPDPGYFFGALCYLDWSKVFSRKELILAIGCPVDQIMSLLEDNSRININDSGLSQSYIFKLPAFTAHARNYFDSVNELIERNRQKNEINAATYEKFEKLWIRNSLKNVENIKKCRTVSSLCKSWQKDEFIFSDTFLSGKFNGMAKNSRKTKFLVLGAGPTLEKLLPVLNELKKQMTIVCVETALKALNRAGINPDFILITDPQYWAYKHIAGLSAPQSILICPLSVYPSVFRFKCREILLCSDMFPVSQFYENTLGNFGDLGAGGSVASSAFNLCVMLGAKEIYLAGLDLSYPEKQTHIKGSSAEQTFHTISTRLTSAEKCSIGSMYSAKPEYSESYDGKKVLTDSRMKMFAWWFESRIAGLPDTKVYSLSKESMKIPGVSFKALTELSVSSVLTTETIETDLSSAVMPDFSAITQSDFTSDSRSLSFAALKEKFKEELLNLSYLINSCTEACLVNGPEKDEKLRELEEKINSNPLKEIVRLARPSSKYMEKNPSDPPELAIYRKLQQTIKLYLSF